jgi:hypothetical protein
MPVARSGVPLAVAVALAPPLPLSLLLALCRLPTLDLLALLPTPMMVTLLAMELPEPREEPVLPSLAATTAEVRTAAGPAPAGTAVEASTGCCGCCGPLFPEEMVRKPGALVPARPIDEAEEEESPLERALLVLLRRCTASACARTSGGIDGCKRCCREGSTAGSLFFESTSAGSAG